MSRSEDRNYFIVKHGLDAFTALPGFIWRTGLSRRKIPRGFRQVGVGDRWIEFAYMVDEENYEPCSLVTGFYECVKEKWYGDVPVDRMPREFNKWDEKAWMIEGKTFGKQPGCPVTVPSINDMLWEFRQKKVVGRTALIRISREELTIFVTRRSGSNWIPARYPYSNGSLFVNRRSCLLLLRDMTSRLESTKSLKCKHAFQTCSSKLTASRYGLNLRCAAWIFRVMRTSSSLEGYRKVSSRAREKPNGSIKTILERWRSSVGLITTRTMN